MVKIRGLFLFLANKIKILIVLLKTRCKGVSYLKEDLFQPSLQNNSGEATQSYHIGKLVYVAFFGGEIPTVVLGSRNALWLKVEKKIIYLLGSIGAVLFLLKIGLSIAMFNKSIAIDARTIRTITRIGSVGLYFLYYWAMKKKFQQHLVTGGELKPMLKEALIWIGIAIIIEVGLLGAIGLGLRK